MQHHGRYIWDIEVSPMLCWAYDMYDARILRVEKHWYIQSYTLKRLGGRAVTKALPDFPGYKPGSFDDKALVLDMHKELSKATILIGHNIHAFDLKKANLRFCKYGLAPIPIWKTVDTYKEAGKYLEAPSRSLDFLCRYYGLGQKNAHHSDMWYACHNGDKKAWAAMKRYNCNDVNINERLYLHILPYMRTHPNMSLIAGRAACPKCGENNSQRRGDIPGKKDMHRRQCKSCGGWFQAKENKKGDVVMSN